MFVFSGEWATCRQQFKLNNCKVGSTFIAMCEHKSLFCFRTSYYTSASELELNCLLCQEKLCVGWEEWLRKWAFPSLLLLVTSSVIQEVDQEPAGMTRDVRLIVLAASAPGKSMLVLPHRAVVVTLHLWSLKSKHDIVEVFLGDLQSGCCCACCR